MDNFNDLHCLVCQKWLDSQPMTCCESGERICGRCFDKIDSRTNCPACREYMDDEHFHVDYAARRAVKTLQGPCESCRQEMLLSELRSHEEDCGSAEEIGQLDEHDRQIKEGRDNQENQDMAVDLVGGLEEHNTEENSEAVDELDDGRPLESMNMLDEQAVHKPVHDELERVHEPMHRCEYRDFGCMFEGTSDDLKQHKRTPPLSCSVTKELKRRLQIGNHQLLEIAAISQEIRNMHLLLNPFESES